MIDNSINMTQSPQRTNYARHLSLSVPFKWLAAGWKDLLTQPFNSLFYGILVFIISVSIISTLFLLNITNILFSVLAGFMIMGPALAVGLYEKSRLITEGKTVTLKNMIFVTAQSKGQILFVGVILSLVMIMWVRSAFLLYALFFGMVPFSGFDHIISTVLHTPLGWAFLGVGSAVGGLFAAFSFAISAFSIPMLLNEKVDAFTAMGTSMALAWNNMGVAIIWGSIVVVLFLFSLITGLLGLIIVFPVLGHGTWHAYKAIREDNIHRK